MKMLLMALFASTFCHATLSSKPPQFSDFSFGKYESRSYKELNNSNQKCPSVISREKSKTPRWWESYFRKRGYSNEPNSLDRLIEKERSRITNPPVQEWHEETMERKLYEEWFRDRLLNQNPERTRFALKHLPLLTKPKKNSTSDFYPHKTNFLDQIIERERLKYDSKQPNSLKLLPKPDRLLIKSRTDQFYRILNHARQKNTKIPETVLIKGLEIALTNNNAMQVELILKYARETITQIPETILLSGEFA